jgi:hypothetical protein
MELGRFSLDEVGLLEKKCYNGIGTVFFHALGKNKKFPLQSKDGAFGAFE